MAPAKSGSTEPTLSGVRYVLTAILAYAEAPLDPTLSDRICHATSDVGRGLNGDTVSFRLGCDRFFGSAH